MKLMTAKKTSKINVNKKNSHFKTRRTTVREQNYQWKRSGDSFEIFSLFESTNSKTSSNTEILK